MSKQFKKINAPASGEAISVDGSRLSVPMQPIIPYIEGDGIGPDIMRASQKVWNAAVSAAYGTTRAISWFEIFAGSKAQKIYEELLPQDTLDAINFYRVAIKGPLMTPVGGGYRSLNVSLRQKLDLYACVRPAYYFEGIPSPVVRPQDMDMVIFRENTEDVYSGIEWQRGSTQAKKVIEFLQREFGISVREDSGLGLKPISETATKRLVRKAIEYAIGHERKSVTLVHKGNIMKFTEGSFRDWGYEVATGEFADSTITEDAFWKLKEEGKTPKDGTVIIKDRIADSMFQQVLTRPREYDVIALPNLNGDYLSDACAAQIGGLGMAAGANIGDGLGLFEATHGCAPKYANQDKVNPSALILSGVMMFDYLGWPEVAEVTKSALAKTIKQKKVTYDLARFMPDSKPLATSAFASAIVENMK